MNKRIHAKPPAPTDEEILAYDNVPVNVAARYLDKPENWVRLLLREGRSSFGTAVVDKQLSPHISPGGLVRYKREGAPCMDYDTMKFMMEDVVRKVIQEELEQICGAVIRQTIQAEFAQLMENIGQTVERALISKFGEAA